MGNTITTKIYFSYSGRDMDKDMGQPAKRAIEDLTRPGEDGQIYAKATPHSTSNGGRKKTFPEELLTTLHKSRLVQAIFILIKIAFGEQFYKKIKSMLNDPNWRAEAEKCIERSDVLVVLYSRNSWEEQKAENLMWEISTAKRLNRNVITCSIDNRYPEMPEWVKKADSKAINYTQEELRKKIVRHSLKDYHFSSSNPSDLKFMENGKEFEQYKFEQYKMYKEDAEKLEAKRAAVMNLYPGAITAMLTLIAQVIASNSINWSWTIVLICVMTASFLGIIASLLGESIVRYYKNVYTAKQRLINAIEETLPLQLNSVEYYEIMKDPLNRGRYESFGETILSGFIHSLCGLLFFGSVCVLLFLHIPILFWPFLLSPIIILAVLFVKAAWRWLNYPHSTQFWWSIIVIILIAMCIVWLCTYPH